MTQTERRRFLLSRLLSEAPEYRHLAVPDDAAGQKQLLRALLNVRPPRDASPEFLQVQDEYLRAELAQKGVTVLEGLTPAPYAAGTGSVPVALDRDAFARMGYRERLALKKENPEVYKELRK